MASSTFQSVYANRPKNIKKRHDYCHDAYLPSGTPYENSTKSKDFALVYLSLLLGMVTVVGNGLAEESRETLPMLVHVLTVTGVVHE